MTNIKQVSLPPGLSAVKKTIGTYDDNDHPPWLPHDDPDGNIVCKDEQK